MKIRALYPETEYGYSEMCNIKESLVERFTPTRNAKPKLLTLWFTMVFFCIERYENTESWKQENTVINLRVNCYQPCTQSASWPNTFEQCYIMQIIIIVKLCEQIKLR